MTLVMNLNIGGSLALMTSDTRKLMSMGFLGVEIKHTYSSDKSKIERLTPFCIFGGGGTDSLVEKIKSELKESDAIYIEDFIKPFKESVARLREGLFYRRDMDDDEAAQIFMTGFDSSGSIGVISFVTGKGSEVDYREFGDSEFDLLAAAPSSDELMIALEQAKYIESQGFVEDRISYLADIQRAYHKNDPDSVSEIFDYIAIYKDPITGAFSSFEDSVNLTK